MQPQFKRSLHKQRGFTLIEMVMAMGILVVGFVAVAQLVPVSIGLNSGNHHDSTALVIAQRELNEMLGQPITATAFTDPQGVLCPTGNSCSLGDPTQPKQPIGSPVIMLNNRPLVDFSQAQVAGYGFNYADPNDPLGTTYDVRWTVITFANGGTPIGKRLILGVRRQGGNRLFLPITLDTMVEK